MELKELETALSCIGPKSNIQPCCSLLEKTQPRQSDECQVTRDRFAEFGFQVSELRLRTSMSGFQILSNRWAFGIASFLWCVTIVLAGPAFAADVPTGVTNIFKPLSTPAQAIYEVSLLVLAICAGIFLVVAGLLVYTLFRFRQRPGDDGHEPPQVYGSNQIELAWTVIPIVVVFVLFLATARTIYDVQGAAPPADALNITVVGHQWWWEIRYPELGIVTANELHVPVSVPTKRRPTFLRLESADVAHSFWAPQLAGKTDLIPNRTNHMWIEPKQPGTY